MARPRHAIDAFLDDILRRRVNRRQAVRRAAAMGLGLPALAALPRERAAAQVSEPPDVPRRPRIFAMPGGLGVDPYAWLENPDDPEVIAYIEAENAYTEAVMAPTKQLQETIYQELLGRIQRTDASAPTPWNGYRYYTRTEEGKDYEIICRKRGDDAPEEILLDLNAIAGDYLALAVWRPSPDNRYLAYNLDETGEEFYPIFVKDLQNGQVIEQLPPSFDIEWAPDSQTLYYCRQDEIHRPFQLNRHVLGDDPASDAVLYEEGDAEFWLRIYPAKDRSHLFLESSTFDTYEVQALPLDRPDAALIPLALRNPGVQYFAEHHGDRFFVLTDEQAPNFKLMATPAANPDRAKWVEVIPHRDDVLIGAQDPTSGVPRIDAFERHLVLYGREHGLSRIWTYDLDSGSMRPIPVDEAVFRVALTNSSTGGENWEFATTRLRFGYSSPVTPDTVYEYDMDSGARTRIKQVKVLGGHDPSRYVTEQRFATAEDGARVPISIVYLREPPAGLPPGPRPLRLDGYGAYGVNSEPVFSILRLALIDRGVTFAVAHVRGGAELGSRWWNEGRLLNKRTTFTDFIACAEQLIAEGHTTADRLVIRGGSAGGLLMGAVANMRPDLFRAINANVPLADVPAFLLRSSIGPVNQDELGDPLDPETYRYQLGYSPYQNVAKQAYPAMLVTASLNDNRTPYWLPLKWVARLRDARTDDNPLLLRTQMGAGHGGVSGFYDQQQETAFLYAFFLMALGMEGVAPAAATPEATPRAAQRPEPPGSRTLVRGGNSTAESSRRGASSSSRLLGDLA